MTIKEAYEDLSAALLRLHSEGEAYSMTTIVFEDVFKVFNFKDLSILSKAQFGHYQEIKDRLLQQEPVQYIIGEADFFGLRFKVNPSVLIPRSETEELVYWIEQTIQEKHTNIESVLDIGTGSGCIPITLKKRMPELEIMAVDVSTEALKTAQTNGIFNKVVVDFQEVNILNEAQWLTLPFFDCIVSNPPYIPHKEKELMPFQVLNNEPHLALFTEDDAPLVFYQHISDFALKHLNKDGFLFFECNEFNAKEVAQMLQEKGFTDVVLEADMQGKERMVRGKL